MVSRAGGVRGQPTGDGDQAQLPGPGALADQFRPRMSTPVEN